MKSGKKKTESDKATHESYWCKRTGHYIVKSTPKKKKKKDDTNNSTGQG